MDKAQTFIDNMLEHAAPQFYDPVKAHEYYVKTRELKGRRDRAAGKGLNTRQKNAFDYSTSEIAKAKQADLDKLTEKVNADIAAIKDAAQTRAAEITSKFQAAINRLTINRAAVSNETANQKTQQRDAYNAERADAAKQVKAAVDAAKQNFQKLKLDLVAKYDDTTQSEYDAIKKTVR